MSRIVLLFSRLLNLFPLPFLFFVGDLIGLFWFEIVRFRRKVVLENLHRIFDGELEPEQIQKLALRNYCNYGRALMELLVSLSWSKEICREQVPIEGLENVMSWVRSGQGGYLLTCHLGNWELAVEASVAHGVPLDIVAKRARNATADAGLAWYRRKVGCGVISETRSVREILQSIAGGRFVGFMIDQFMGPPIGLPVRFFGHTAGTTVSLALLTEKRDVPIVPAYAYRDETGRSRVAYEPALKFPPFSDDKDERLFQKTQFFNDYIERIIRKHPEQWLWLHRRWKPYRGEPRWHVKAGVVILKPVTALFCFFLLVAPQPSRGAETGIPIPTDPQVTMPRFDEPAGSPFAIPPAPPVIPKVEPESKKSRRERRRARKRKHEASKNVASLAPPTVVAVPSKPVNVLPVVPVEKIPFEVGEQLQIDLNWSALSAGRALLEVRKGPEFEGRPTFWLWGNVLSSRVVDAIYHVDNTIESYIDLEGIVPYKYLLHMVESKQLKETRVAFGQGDGKAFFWSRRISQRWGNDTTERTDTLATDARDMFSTLYYARTLDYSLGKEQKFMIYENGQNLELELLPVANELINSSVGSFQCWKLKVTVKLNNVLKPTGDMFLWLSDDSKRYPVRFDAKIKIGSLIGTLTKVRERQ